MYPKVKVREQKYEDDQHVAVGLQLLQSLSLHDFSYPEEEHQDVSPVFIARIPKSPLRNVVTPSNSTPREPQRNDKEINEKEKTNVIKATFLANDSTSLTDTEKNDVKIDEKEKPNIRASSILRPRAVLSSPYNDAVIGNNNRLKAELPAALRNHDMVPNRHAKAQCKASPTHIKSQLNTTSSNDVHDNKSDLKGKKGSAMAVPSQRRYLRTWKF